MHFVESRSILPTYSAPKLKSRVCGNNFQNFYGNSIALIIIMMRGLKLKFTQGFDEAPRKINFEAYKVHSIA